MLCTVLNPCCPSHITHVITANDAKVSHWGPLHTNHARVPLNVLSEVLANSTAKHTQVTWEPAVSNPPPLPLPHTHFFSPFLQHDINQLGPRCCTRLRHNTFPKNICANIHQMSQACHRHQRGGASRPCHSLQDITSPLGQNASNRFRQFMG